MRTSSVRWRRDQLGGGRRGALPVPGAAAAPAGARRGSRRAPRPRRPRAGGGGHLGREGAGVQVTGVELLKAVSKERLPFNIVL